MKSSTFISGNTILITQLFVLVSVIFNSCKTVVPFEVEYVGALKNMMQAGDISSKITLKELENRKHLYALGAVENLKGEILVLDSKPFIGQVTNKKLQIDSSFEKNATLLVYASIKDWVEIALPAHISSYSQLEEFVAKAAAENKINIQEPFPFLLEGIVSGSDWHVIDWEAGDREHTHEKHRNAGLRGTLTNEYITGLGFYSNKHHTIFTHHSTNMHIHLKTKDNRISGHLDDIVLADGMRLKLPRVP